MPVASDTPDWLEMGFPQSPFGLSARRVWEHTELGQVKVFKESLSACLDNKDAETFIDVIRFGWDSFRLLGFTLAQLKTGHYFSENLSQEDRTKLLRLAEEEATGSLVKELALHLYICSRRKIIRNGSLPFLHLSNSEELLGVPYLHSTLKSHLNQMTKAKATAAQWLATINNFPKKGIRADEIERSGLCEALVLQVDEGLQLSGGMLADSLSFDALRLSIIPVINLASAQLQFGRPPAKTGLKTKKYGRPQIGQIRTVKMCDRVLGYRVEQVEHESLWGREVHWQAVTHDGQVIADAHRPQSVDAPQSAAELAMRHAERHFPKRNDSGQWSGYAWTGGEDYREWLVTLPHFSQSFFSSHYPLRNILAHIRCDVREGRDGERVLFLHEVQSDWARGSDSTTGERPPFFREWSSLVMKLMLLHAAHRGLDALAWTQGRHQVARYKGLGKEGLMALYDRTLPRDVNRIVQPLGIQCEMVEVFVPTNFSIKRSERGYEVFDRQGNLLGIEVTLEDARQLMPDAAHEQLYDVHGVRLTEAIRATILKEGFPAWG